MTYTTEISNAELAVALSHLRDRLKNHGSLSGATSYVQQKMQIRYNHAAAIMEEFERRFVVTAPNETGERKLLREKL